MNWITHFNQTLVEQCPDTHALLLTSRLWIHDAVDRITLHGSRGLQGGARYDSDLDLCLIVNSSNLAAALNLETFMRLVLNTTVQKWQSEIGLDLAAVFDKSLCGLRCFEHNIFNPNPCSNTVNCIGLFKVQKGFDGFVSDPTIDCSKIYPLMTIWKRECTTSI